ncbi:MAG: PQQ-dependent sugar dehydrogenase [Gemmatimonadota bacterium]
MNRGAPTLVRSAGRVAALLWLGLTAASCGAAVAGQSRPSCDPDDGGLALPEGFCALVVADGLGRARHMGIAPNGDIFVVLRGGRGGGAGVAALRDTTGDGRADVVVRFGDAGGTGLSLHGEELYVAPDWGVLRYRIPAGQLTPSGPPDTIVAGLPGPRTQHAAKSAVLDGAGHLYVNIGAPANSCQVADRTAGSPGQDPCPLLERRAGIWRFEADRTGQTHADGLRFATGLRNTFALAVHPETGILYGVQHGRDQLHQNWPELFDEEAGAEKPAEELVEIQQGDDFGWPYCFYDPALGRKVLGPEYGGDGERVGRCADKEDPLVAFPAHWAPESLLFYAGDQFPERYRGGAFVAFHGSWNRAPLPQAGYNVAFVPFSGGRPTGEWEVFADGFAGERKDPRNAAHRPTGLAIGPDGSLYVTEDRSGRIWRILYRG